MRFFKLLFKLFVFIFVFPFMSFGTDKLDDLTGKTTTHKPRGFLRTNGYDMVDEDGNKVYLKGVGLGNWLLPEGYMWKLRGHADRPRRIEALVYDLIGKEKGKEFWSSYRKYYITEADIKRISELGFNSVRLPLNSRWLLDEDREELVYNEESFKLIDNLIKWCKKYGVYVILDMHGAPGSQTGDNIDDSKDNECGLFIEKKNQDRLEALWLKIVGRYRDEPTVAAYDLLNEPLVKRPGIEEFYKGLETLYNRLTAAIRAIDKKHMITLEGANWANDWSVFSEPFDDNTFYQFHYYCWDYPPNIYSIKYFTTYRENFGTPVWVGETGEGSPSLYWGMCEYLESENIGFSFWPWKKMDTTNTPYSIRPPENWDKVARYAGSLEGNKPEGRGYGDTRQYHEKPAPEEALKIFNEFIENIKLKNCVYFENVVSSIFRRVPAKIEAENFGRQGEGKSYSVLEPREISKIYRTEEPVKIELFNEVMTGQSRRPVDLCAILQKSEWLAYDFNSFTDKKLDLVVNVKSEKGKGKLKFSAGDQNVEIEVLEGDWTEIYAGKIKVNKGKNSIKMTVTEGILKIDWFELK